MLEITVPVPDDRVGDFYEFFGRWVSGAIEPFRRGADSADMGRATALPEGSDTHAEQKNRAWADSDEDLDDAVRLWRKLSSNARRMFGVLVNRPGQRFTGQQIAEAAGIANGSSGVAGVLAWPGRYCAQMRRELPSQWMDATDGRESAYWMEPEAAALFSKAAEVVGNE